MTMINDGTRQKKRSALRTLLLAICMVTAAIGAWSARADDTLYRGLGERVNLVRIVDDAYHHALRTRHSLSRPTSAISAASDRHHRSLGARRSRDRCPELTDLAEGTRLQPEGDHGRHWRHCAVRQR